MKMDLPGRMAKMKRISLKEIRIMARKMPTLRMERPTLNLCANKMLRKQMMETSHLIRQRAMTLARRMIQISPLRTQIKRTPTAKMGAFLADLLRLKILISHKKSS
jgi:hypothetical protein